MRRKGRLTYGPKVAVVRGSAVSRHPSNIHWNCVSETDNIAVSLLFSSTSQVLMLLTCYGQSGRISEQENTLRFYFVCRFSSQDALSRQHGSCKGLQLQSRGVHIRPSKSSHERILNVLLSRGRGCNIPVTGPLRDSERNSMMYACLLAILGFLFDARRGRTSEFSRLQVGNHLVTVDRVRPTGMIIRRLPWPFLLTNIFVTHWPRSIHTAAA
jgi:hypothetical protein